MKVKMKGSTLKQLLLPPNSGGYSAYAVPNSGQYSKSWMFSYSILYIIHGKGTNLYCILAFGTLFRTVFLVSYSVVFCPNRIHIRYSVLYSMLEVVLYVSYRIPDLFSGNVVNVQYSVHYSS